MPESKSAGQPSTEEPRKCWICFSDETEDGPETSSWRTPCQCALTAHESCLLDWIADMEAPSSPRTAASPKEIRCPQCKSEIFLSRPRNRFVETVGLMEKTAGKLLWPGVFFGLSYSFFLGCSHHGAHTIRMIFGRFDAEAILAPSQQPSVIEKELRQTLPRLFPPLAESFFQAGFFRSWRGLRVEFGLPLIPMALIASRTKFADPILPILPILFFATHPKSHELATGPYWPPSAAITLTVLPYLRGIYDECLERAFGDHERRWVKEIQPRLGREDGDAQETEALHNHDDANAIEVEVDVEIVGDGDGGEEDAAPGPQIPGRQAPHLNEPPADAGNPNLENAQPRGQEARQRARENNDPLEEVQALVEERQQAQQNLGNHQQHQNQHQHQQGTDLIATGPRIAETVLGALFFPTISAIMGEGLRLLLPVSWTVSQYSRNNWGVRRTIPTGVLQTRWGRSIVGGCLFVVLKDAVRIYCRWRMAQAFRHRRVLDWDKKLGKVIK